MIISKTPVRISFFGGGTDYPSYYLNHSGAVLGTTIDKYIYISLNKLSPFFDYNIRIGYSKSELVNSIGEIQHPSIRECLRYYEIEDSLDIHIFADLPARTGLGSSSAFTVGFLKALDLYTGRHSTQEELAHKALYIEQQLIGEKVGSQDQCHAAYGGFNLFEFSKQSINVTPVEIQDVNKSLLNDSLMLFFTGVKRYAEDILDEQIKKTQSSQNDQYLKQMYEMVFKAKTILEQHPQEGFLKAFGQLLDESWNLKKQLSSKISSSHIDDLYHKALEAGAKGGKLCGAGFGGFLLLVVPEMNQDRVRKALHPLMEVPLNFEESGSQIIYENEHKLQGITV